MNRAIILGSALSLVIWGLFDGREAQATCGAVSCFIVIGSQQQIPQKGLLTINGIYNYTPMRLLEGTSGLIPHPNQDRQRMTLDEHKEVRSITQTYTLDMNYGVTESVGVQVTVPYIRRKHRHFEEVGEENGGFGNAKVFSDNGIGDIRVTAKYNMLPTLRSALVTGLGIELPTGDYNAKDTRGLTMESPLQIGRGQVGLVGSLYQTYEVIPHRLNQFAFASYRHTFRNSDGYQFGDEWLVNVGMNVVTVPWLVLTGQFNYRYLVHDNFTSSLRQAAPFGGGGAPPTTLDGTILDRRVPNSGSTYFAFTPGFLVNAAEKTQFYFNAQIPLARDSNDNLAQGTSFVFGMTQYVQLFQ
jgi:hypothetical protein